MTRVSCGFKWNVPATLQGTAEISLPQQSIHSSEQLTCTAEALAATPLVHNAVLRMFCLLQTHLRDFVVWLVAFIVTTFAGVELGLMSSIALSLLILVLESSFPHTAQLGHIGKSNVYRSAGTDSVFCSRSVLCLLLVWVSGR
jgi:hypothetical protein